MSMSIDEIRHPRFVVKWHKYYLADEVDRHLYKIAEDTRLLRADHAEQETNGSGLSNTVIALQQEIQALSGNNAIQAQTIANLTDKTTHQEAVISDQVHEISALGDQLTQYRNDNLSQTEKLAQQNLMLNRFQTQIDKQKEQIAVLETQCADDIRQEAIRKAEQIVSRAIADSDRILLQATEQRGRLIAACRAAYYGALQFKQDLADQFKKMERELDASIDTLQLVDNTPLSLGEASQDDESREG